MTTTALPSPTTGAATQRYTSGRELIEAVKARREQAQQAHDLFASLDKDLPTADALDGDRIDGVKVLWISEGRAARDETAFRHALATAHRLREASQRMTDAKIIDAYERAYNVAQAVGSDHREPDMPPMRDRQTMARRVRGYVLSSNRAAAASSFTGATGGVGARERKALATMGRKGGKKAAQRWKDRDSDYAKAELKKLQQTHRKKRVQGQTTRARIQAVLGQSYIETGELPTRKEIMRETGLSESTVKRHVRALREAGLMPD